MARLFIECTRTATSGLHTGIQRVVRRTLRESQAIPVVIENNKLKQLQKMPGSGLEGTHANLGSTVGSSTVGSPTVGSGLAITHSEPLTIQPDDIILMIDSAWYIDPWPALLAAKQAGATLGFVWHDLIPLHYPALFAPGLSSRFKHYLTNMIEHADRIICVSRTVRDQLAAYIQEHAPWRLNAIALDYNHPGADMLTTAGGPCRPELQTMFDAAANKKLLLAVGTIEPRKGYGMLLDACEALWSEGLSPILCIVGSTGWQVEAVLQKLERHPERGQRLFVWHNLHDAELDLCYRRASCLVYPSLAEGFGLPIAEAGWRKLPVLLSDTTIHREVAGPLAHYFSLTQPHALQDALRGYISGHWQFNPGWPEAGRFQSWHSATTKLLSVLRQPWLESISESGDQHERAV